MSKKIKICFVAPTTWPVLSGDKIIEGAGGAEVQQSIISKALAQRKFSVSMVSLDYGQEDNINIHDIRILKAHNPNSGIPVVRFIHPRATSFWKAMKRADADIYYQRSAGMMTGLVAAFCKASKRKFIYAAASDTDFIPGEELIKYSRDKILYKWGRSHADAVIVQNDCQSRMAKQLGIKNITLVNNAYAMPQPNKTVVDGKGVLWVGTLKPVKRPEVLISIAKLLPEVSFTMIGKMSGNRQYDNAMLKKIAQTPNINYLGFVPFAEIDPYFQQADVMMNTSKYEGFPNTFLQAWARAVPTLSFVIPGNGTKKELPGSYVQSVDEAVAILQKWHQDEGSRKIEGDECNKYFLEHHEIKRVIPHYERLFSQLLAK